MDTHRYLLILAFTLLLGAQAATAQGFLKTDGKRIVNGNGENVVLRGMGLGGWMLQEGYMLRVEKIGQQQHVIRGKIEELIGKEKTTAFYDAWLANHTRKIDVDSMAAWGFNSVRLAMHYNLYTLPIEQEPVPGKNTWLDKGFAMTDSLLNWCKSNKVYLILDLHGAPGGQGNDNNISDRDPSKPSLWQSEANQQKMIALWRKLAERYANEPWIGAYDIINEPNWGFEKAEDKNGCGEQKNEPLKKLMVDVTNAIREVDKKHIIIIEGNCWGNNYKGVFPLWDNNTVVSFHKYWSFNDAATIKGPLEIRETNNAPIWLGESGENSNAWFRDAIHLVETNNIGWAWWPLKKLGHNNPLQVKMPAGYQKVVDYWAGKGPKPSADEAYKGLMEFANNLKLENCIYHKDVIDAMFRQVNSDDTMPFKKLTPGTAFSAADYDLGRNRFAYMDKDTGNYWVSGKEGVGNKGHIYRNDGVDLSADADGKYVVDNFEKDEWIQYTVQAPGEGNYSVKVVISSNENAAVSISAAVKSYPEVTTAGTGGKWKELTTKGVGLKKGENVIRVTGKTGTFKLKSIQLVKE